MLLSPHGFSLIHRWGRSNKDYLEAVRVIRGKGTVLPAQRLSQALGKVLQGVLPLKDSLPLLHQ